MLETWYREGTQTAGHYRYSPSPIQSIQFNSRWQDDDGDHGNSGLQKDVDDDEDIDSKKEVQISSKTEIRGMRRVFK